MKKITILILIMFFQLKAFSQNGSVLVCNNPQAEYKEIFIKWTSEELLYENGVNIYRKELNSDKWGKLNSNPILMQKNTSIINDKEIAEFVKFTSMLDMKKIDGMIKLMVMLKLLQNNKFAEFIGVMYIDKSIKPDAEYQYKITKIKNNKEEELGISKSIKVGKYIKEIPPQNIKCIALDKSATIKWEFEEYRFFAINIYRRAWNENISKKINKLPIIYSMNQDSSGKTIEPEYLYKDTSLINGKKYYYSLKAIDFFGFEGEISNEVELAPIDMTPPDAPTNIVSKIEKYNVKITWNKPIKKNDIIGYNIYKSISNNNEDFEKLNSIVIDFDTNTYIDKNLETGFYYYYVSSVDSTGNEAASLTTLIEVKDITPPSAPIDVIAKADTGKIILSWKVNLEKDVWGYLIYRNIDGNLKGEFNILNVEPIIDNSFTDKLPKQAQNKFVYYVVAMDSSFNKSKPSEFVYAKMPDVTAPKKPFIKNVVCHKDSVLVEWIENIETDLKGYNIFKSKDLKNKKDAILVNKNIISKKAIAFKEKNYNDGGIYYYYLVAVDTVGNNSEYSNPFPVQLSKLDTNISTIKNFNVKYVSRKNNTKIDWEIKTNQNFIGALLYKGSTKENLIPFTDNIVLKNHKLVDVKLKEKKIFYQLRVFHNNGMVVKSDIIEVDVKNK